MSGDGLVRKTLRDQRGMTIGMSIAGFLVAMLIIALYPQFADQFAEIELPDIYDALFGEVAFAEPAGFIAAEYFGWFPLLVIAIAVIAGTASIASEEGNGTLELLLAEPVTRRALILRKTVGLAASIAIICAVSYAGLVAGRLMIADFDLGYLPLFEATVVMLLISWFFLGLSILGSALFPGRMSAAITVTALIVIAYFSNIAASLVDGLSFLEHAQPFGWADYPATILDGLQVLESALLLGFALAFVAAAVWSFERREIGAVGWPRLRPRVTREAPHAAAKGEGARAGE